MNSVSAETGQNIRFGPYRVNPGPPLYAALLAAYCLGRIWFTWGVELGKDEAAYWYWGQDLDASYALLPFALFGLAHALAAGHEWVLRLPSILAGAGAAILLFRLCRLYSLSPGRSLAATAVFAASHWMWHASSYLHPDAFLALCWLWALHQARLSLDAPRPATYISLGTALGLCLLCKYSAAFLAAGLFLWLLVTTPPRRRIALLLQTALPCALVALPLAWAQWRTDFYLPSTLSTLSRIVEEDPLPWRLALFLLNPLTFVSPPLLWLLYRAGWRNGRRAAAAWRAAAPDSLLALLPALALFAGFAFFALSRGQIKGNWILPGFLGLWPLALAGLSRRALLAVFAVGVLQAWPIAYGLKYPGQAAALASDALDATYVAMVSAPDRQREPSYSWSERLGEYHGWSGLAAALEDSLRQSGIAAGVPLSSTQYGTVFAVNYYAGRPIYTVDDPRFRFLTSFEALARPRPERTLFVVRQGTDAASSLDAVYPHRRKLYTLERHPPKSPPVRYDLYLYSLRETQ